MVLYRQSQNTFVSRKSPKIYKAEFNAGGRSTSAFSLRHWWFFGFLESWLQEMFFVEHALQRGETVAPYFCGFLSSSSCSNSLQAFLTFTYLMQKQYSLSGCMATFVADLRLNTPANGIAPCLLAFNLQKERKIQAWIWNWIRPKVQMSLASK